MYIQLPIIIIICIGFVSNILNKSLNYCLIDTIFIQYIMFHMEYDWYIILYTLIQYLQNMVIVLVIRISFKVDKASNSFAW